MATGKNSSASVAVPIDPRDRVLPPEPVVLTGALRHKDGGNERQFAYVPRVVRGSQGSQPVAPHSPSPQVNFSEDTQKRPWTTSQEDLETGEGERSTNGFDGKLPEKSGADEQSPRTLLQRLKPWLAPIGLLALLYMFICSLEFLSSAFRLIAGKTAGMICNGAFDRLSNNLIIY